MDIVVGESKDLAGQLRAYFTLLQTYLSESKREESPPEVVQVLAAPLARLTKLVIPHSHQKLDEYIEAATEVMQVNSHQHGADLLDGNNNPIELKVSIVRTSTKNTAHFNWPIPGAVSENDKDGRRKLLLEKLDEKTKGGYALFVIRNGIGEELERFKFSHEFLRGYFERITIGDSDKHHISCPQCKKCHKFHRLELYRKTDLLIQQGKPVDWNAVLSRTKSTC